MSVSSKNEFYLTLRSLIFFAGIAAPFYIYRITVRPEVGTVIIRLPNECSKTLNHKGQEFVSYDCFRHITTAKIEKGTNL